MTRVSNIIILGTAGNCIDILETINDINKASERPKYRCVGFLDDNQGNWGSKIYGIEVLGPLSSAPQYSDALFVNGIGSPFNFWKKEDIISKTNIPIGKFETIIHPSAIVSKTSIICLGTVIFPNVTVATEALIGNHVIILPNSVVNHDDIIGDYTCITSGVNISGGVVIGKSCYIGTGTSIKSDITIGRYSLIGMGSIVIRDVPENTVVVGNPARYLRRTMS